MKVGIITIVDHTNYGNIQNKNLCIVGESEKFPQQLDSFGCYLGLASCGCHLSDTQAKYIKSLLVDKTILAYDEGLEEEYMEFLGNKVVRHRLPIRPGRNLAVIVETASINYRQKKMGYNAAQELYKRVQENLARR